MISVSVPSASVQCVKSDRQVSFGWSALKRWQEDRGAFLRLGGDLAVAFQDSPDSCSADVEPGGGEVPGDGICLRLRPGPGR